MISTPALFGVTALVLVLLAMIFPREALIERMLNPRTMHADDVLAARYGAGMVRDTPANEPLRQAVVEKQVDIGELERARNTLKPLRQSRDAQVRRDAGLKEREIVLELIGAAEGDAAKERPLLADLRLLLASLLAETWPAEQLLAFAREAAARGWPDIAGQYYVKLIETAPAPDATIVREAVEHFLAQGSYAQAAELHFILMRRARGLDARRAHYLAALGVLEQSNRPREAFAVARSQLGDLIDDPASVRAAVRLATFAEDAGAGAELYFTAMRRARTLEARRASFLNAASLLEQMNRPREALASARAQLGDLIDDPAAFRAMLRLASAADDADAAAELHFSARDRSRNPAERRARFIAGVQALQSANRLADALNAADARIGDLADDEPTLVFLVQLARTANDQVRAQNYARRLVRVGASLDRPGAAARDALARVAAFLISEARAQSASGPRPYSDTSYQLAYDVFVANSNFADARRVAEAALTQRPGDLAWMERLARVNEWLGDASAALAIWNEIAARTRSQAALQAILRLAPGLGDDEALLAAWRMIAAQRALTDAEARELADLFERTARVDEGLAFLRERARRDGSVESLALVGYLAARAGRTAEAIEAYEQLAARGALDVDRAITLATLHFSQGDFRAAFDTLARIGDRVGPNEVEYWRLFGDLAWQLGDDAAASRAYEALRATNRLERFELARLLRLMRTTRPADAARLAEAGWRESRDPQLFYVAAEIYAARRDLAALDRLFATVELADEPRFRNDPYFFTLRGNWHAQRARSRQALNDFKRALALRPADRDLKAQYLWLTIELREIAELRSALSAWEREGRETRALWPAFAAGYQTLGEPRRALPFYRIALADRKDDYLWLLGFADALEDAGEGGMAWRVRRHAWHAIRGRIAADPDRLKLPAELLGYARLTTQFAPGDSSLAAVRRLLSQASAGSGDRASEAIARELALGYAIGAGEFDRARAWLWTQYGRALTRPGWGELAIALDGNDLESMERLIAGRGEGLPRYDRVSAARAVGQSRLAQTLAWESLETYPFDDEMHQRLQGDIRETASSVVAETAAYRYGFLRGNDSRLMVQGWLTPQWRFAPFVRETTQRSRDSSQLVNVPSSDTRIGAQLEWRAPRRRAQLEIAQRRAIENLTSVEALYEERPWTRLGLRAIVGRNLYANETAALRVGGVKDELRLDSVWDFAKREYARLSFGAARYYTQARTQVGEGERVELEAGHRLRTDYPNLTVRGYAGYQWFSRASTTGAIGTRLNPAGVNPDGSFFLPPSFAFYGAAIGFGQELRTNYSRALRPFADAGITYNSVIGSGYSFLAGVGGSVIGADHLSVGVLRSKGGATATTLYQELFVRYQLYF